jgi:hypothetical protein
MAQRVRLVADWTIALMFRPPLTKIDLDSEKTMLLRHGASGTLDMNPTRVSK